MVSTLNKIPQTNESIIFNYTLHSAARLLKSMEENEIIECIRKGAGRRPSLFAFRKLLKIINK